MTDKNIIIVAEKRYLAKVSLNKDKDFVMEAVTEKIKVYLEDLIKAIIKEGVKARRGDLKQEGKETIRVEYLKPIDKNDPFYLEAIAETLTNKGFLAFVLDKNRADLYVLVKQSDLSQSEQQKIIHNLRSFSDKEVNKLISVFIQEKKEEQKIDKKYEKEMDELRKQNQKKWQEVVKKEKEQLISLIK